MCFHLVFSIFPFRLFKLPRQAKDTLIQGQKSGVDTLSLEDKKTFLPKQFICIWFSKSDMWHFVSFSTVLFVLENIHFIFFLVLLSCEGLIVFPVRACRTYMEDLHHRGAKASVTNSNCLSGVKKDPKWYIWLGSSRMFLIWHITCKVCKFGKTSFWVIFKGVSLSKLTAVCSRFRSVQKMSGGQFSPVKKLIPGGNDYLCR